jgi:hypothetical protein
MSATILCLPAADDFNVVFAGCPKCQSQNRHEHRSAETPLTASTADTKSSSRQPATTQPGAALRVTPDGSELPHERQRSYDAAVAAISRVHGDTSVDLRTTLANLQALRGEVDILIDAVETDIRREDRQE